MSRIPTLNRHPHNGIHAESIQIEYCVLQKGRDLFSSSNNTSDRTAHRCNPFMDSDTLTNIQKMNSSSDISELEK